MPRRMKSYARTPLRGRTEISPFMVTGWQDGWRPDLQKTIAPPTSVFDLLNVVWNDDYTISKRHGYTNIASAVSGVDAPDFLLAPRVFTTVGGVFPQYSQQVLHFNKNDGELWYQSLGKLWQEFEDPGNGDDMVWSNHSIGAASDTAVNRFRVWPITAVTVDDSIYISSLRFGGYDNNTTLGTPTSGDWQTQTGDQDSLSLPIVYDVEAGTFSRPAHHALAGGSTGFVSCRTMIAKYARVFVANLFMENTYRYPSRIYWSGTDLDPSLVQTFEADNFIAVGADDGQEIVRMLSFGDQILIFKNQSIWTLVGTDDTTFALYQLDDKLGTEGTYAATATAGSAYFLDERTGVWQYDGAQFTNISLPIKEKLLAELNREAAYKAVVEMHDNYLYVSIPVGSQSSAVQSVTYVYDTELGVWTRWDYGLVPTPFPMYSDLQVTGPTVSLVNNAFSGRPAAGVFMLNDALNDDGSAISSYVTLPWLNPGMVADRHRVRRLDVVADEGDGTITIDAFYNLEFDTGNTTLTFNPATGTENYLSEHQTLDTKLWSWLCLRFTNNVDDEDMNLYGFGLTISTRPNPRGVYTRTGYAHS